MADWTIPPGPPPLTALPPLPDPPPGVDAPAAELAHYRWLVDKHMQRDGLLALAALYGQIGVGIAYLLEDVEHQHVIRTVLEVRKQLGGRLADTTGNAAAMLASEARPVLDAARQLHHVAERPE
jgi:hypothetical protein